MLWRNRNCCGTRVSRITYPKCTPHNIYAYRSVVIRRLRNQHWAISENMTDRRLIESPRPKAGKYRWRSLLPRSCGASMKAPPTRKGAVQGRPLIGNTPATSMKAIPKRKEDSPHRQLRAPPSTSLNESPRPKAGKSGQVEAPNPVTGMPQ